MTPDSMREARDYIQACLEDIHNKAVDEQGDARALTDDEQTRWDEGVAEVQRLSAELDAVEARAAELRRIADAGGRHPAVAPQQIRRDDTSVYDLIERGGSDAQYRDHAMRALETFEVPEWAERVEKHMKRDKSLARDIARRGAPEYLTGFSKMMRGEQWKLTPAEVRAMTVGATTSAGAQVPTHLDPTLILTNDGTNNPIRGISRVVTLPSPGPNTWNGVSTAGVTASWDAEAAEVSDDAPTLAQLAIPVYKGQAFVPASFEAFEDVASLQSDVLMLFRDARDRLEGAAFATGSGSSQPTGIFTEIDATAASERVTTTGQVIGAVDVYGTYAQTPQRHRGASSWLMNVVHLNTIRQLGSTYGSNFTVDMTAGGVPLLFGRPVVECSDAPSTTATTTVDNAVIFGDFSQYVIVDKVAPSIEFIPNLFHTSNNRPSGNRGWLMHWRVGAESVNDNAFTLLQVGTTA